MLIAGQFGRYAFVGLASNAVLYALYLALTGLSMGPKLAMTTAYCAGTLQSFYFNRRWTFRASGGAAVLARYVVVVTFGYTINWTALWVFVDRLGYPHQAVQLVLILLIAVITFSGLRWWVFRVSAPHAGRR